MAAGEETPPYLYPKVYVIEYRGAGASWEPSSITLRGPVSRPEAEAALEQLRGVQQEHGHELEYRMRDVRGAPEPGTDVRIAEALERIADALEEKRISNEEVFRGVARISDEMRMGLRPLSERPVPSRGEEDLDGRS